MRDKLQLIKRGSNPCPPIDLYNIGILLRNTINTLSDYVKYLQPFEQQVS